MNIQKLTSNNNRTIYVFQVQSFPELITNLFLIDDGDRLMLVDTGSTHPDSTAGLDAGFAQINDMFDKSYRIEDLSAILVTHGHIDHYGGLNYLRTKTDAPLGVHLLDRAVLENHEERLLVARERVRFFLESADIAPEDIDRALQYFEFSKKLFQPTPVNFLLSEAEPFADINFIHVPGHCPGMVCLQIDDIMLTADHVLSHITPHQSPESITRNMGLTHYFDSLDKLAKIPDVRLAIGSHDDPMPDMYQRIADIKSFHEKRLEKTLAQCDDPKTLREISEGLFGKREGYVALMALEEATAHVEYLHERGFLLAANLAELESGKSRVIKFVKHG